MTFFVLVVHELSLVLGKASKRSEMKKCVMLSLANIFYLTLALYEDKGIFCLAWNSVTFSPVSFTLMTYTRKTSP